jgi:hypothetical protein
LNAVENTRIACCDMEPPNESSVTQLECLTLGAQYSKVSP